mmetsp:Transcript_100685/g.285329  ORF Transcript_100685/g.285329 Transcript_100685/m.285329 type:complete len:581 (+) Transcript_100685:66-1808(+)|eukprot:CAMPEP_0179255958 /NCGR_PEP_ID=MMETSP0797-20121207/24019_1 /TAXON_ID=47934 /ORGANISM="Dinophysis acuminata, Strain DAEP01" /LENGTH=580 /DNA_ID=CAMNT_0020963877 /DNA_START=66 /DNA_END=1808 /DNA_ORIENTATION=-
MNGKDPNTMPLADETGVYGCIPVNSGRGGAPRGMGGLPPPPTYLSGVPLPPPDTESSVRLTSQDEFEAMVLDMKRSFRAWVDKTEKQIRDNVVQLQREQRAFEEEKARAWQEFVARKQGDYDRIREDKNRADMEAERGTRQIRQEREDARARLQEEREAIERDVQLGRRRFTLEREKFRCEFEAAEKERQLISDHNVATETLVDINVGGVTFESSRQTYTQQPGSLLERLMTGRAQAPRDRDGRIFLDRDSSLFRTIVNFLREPSQPPPSRDAAESDALCQEAEYLGIRFHPYPLVYAVGGHDGSEHLATAEVLDVENQCWRPIRPMQTERQYFGAEVLHARPYLFGGQNLEYTALVETECLDTLRGAWMKGSNLNVPRRNCASTQLDGRIFAIGGYDGERLLSHVEAFDPRMKSWMPLEPMTVPRSAAAATTYGGRVWVLGGTSGSRLRTMERYDPRAGKWEALRSDMVEVRSAARACNCLDRLYALGGTDQNQNVHSSLESFNPEAGASWVFRKSMLRPRMDFGCCVLSDSIMAGGGNHGEAGVLSSTEFYRPELDDWQLGPSMLSPRYGHQLLLVNL